ncbi:MAG: hypothetical protein KF845_06395 [Cyclobacteriaceae bacterium]|nr:hypothetical protein [Cyclobacteriaceae bacterium]
MRSYKFIFFLLISGVGTLYAQPHEEKDSLRFSYLPRYTIKVSPLHVFNFYPSIQVAYEHHLKNNFTLQTDAGYVFSIDNLDRRFKNKRGAKLKLELRYYLTDLIRPKGAHYFSLEPYANIINFDRIIQQTECFDLECTQLYTRWYEYVVKYREQGFSLKYGINRYRGRVTYDMNLGLTLRNVEYKKPAIARGLNQPDTWAWFEIPNERKRTTIGPAAGFRFGYRLVK